MKKVKINIFFLLRKRVESEEKFYKNL